jgi:molybdopterin/thiamine biosynthesis adenylyltransferase/rhodanese-related sulfurtransferase/molybdopterin converting factor small subunit
MVTIHLPANLRSQAGFRDSVTVPGETVGAALTALFELLPAMATSLRAADGELVGGVRVFLDDEDVRSIGGLDAAIAPGASLTLVAPGAGLPDLTADEIARYSRHLILEDVGVDGQRRLKAGSVLCIGTGGLGSPLLLYLAAAGVGRIGLVDFDVVEASNLQRQIIHGTASIGKKKVDSARDRIADLNPNVVVEVFDAPLTSENALSILADWDVVVDGSDNFPTRYLVNDACVILGKPNVYGSIFRFEGQATVFNYQGGPNYRDLYPEPPPPGMVPSCAEGGVLGILPGVIGVIQATEAVKILLGLGTTLSGRLLLYDALNLRFRELKLRPDPLAKPITALIDYQGFCGLKPPPQPVSVQGFQRLSVSEVRDRRLSGWDPLVIDVRKPVEAEIVRLAFADRLQPHERIGEIAGELPRDRDILVHCKLGGRSAKAAQTLADLGFDRVFNMEGGITAWAEEIDRSLPTY